MIKKCIILNSASLRWGAISSNKSACHQLCLPKRSILFTCSTGAVWLGILRVQAFACFYLSSVLHAFQIDLALVYPCVLLHCTHLNVYLHRCEHLSTCTVRTVCTVVHSSFLALHYLILMSSVLDFFYILCIRLVDGWTMVKIII